MRSVLFGVLALSLGFASLAHAVGFASPFTDEAICGNISVAPTLAGPGSYTGSTHCTSICRAVSAQCHRFVVRVASCDTAYAVSNAAMQARSCNELVEGAARILCRSDVKNTLVEARSTIVSQRDAAFDGCDGWESDCQAACMAP
ncbi:MAG TPA: hypothetical protein VMR86_10335 [Myxococcota bacterium]|nr:hypothetical protein [Myxococcota bacterium]